MPRGGYEQTLFEWHAPTVQRAVGDFDSDFSAAPAECKYSNDPKPGEKTLDELITRLTELKQTWADKYPLKSSAGPDS